MRSGGSFITTSVRILRSATELQPRQACKDCKFRRLEPKDSLSNWLQKPVAGHLDEIAPRYPNENVGRGLDGAGWHKSQEVELAENVRTLFLPPYSPELNPQEHVWDELREKFFHNRSFDSLDALETHLEKALRCLESSRE
ncbi:transposase [Nitrosospira multiformis]|uniref:transposase n=1 Tax=Nitrosospira multiformis TaxID=1231 RepID=UPI001113DA81|nr:transposase [Nitrosospira multiformis]